MPSRNIKDSRNNPLFTRHAEEEVPCGCYAEGIETGKSYGYIKIMTVYSI
ncbi:hypothetical protein [Niallia sp. BSM11]